MEQGLAFAKINALKNGDVINISTSYYARKYNNFLDSINSDKPRYTKKMVKNDIYNKKYTRPIVIFYTNLRWGFIIAFSETTSEKIKVREQNILFQNNRIWKKEILLLSKKELLDPYNLSFKGRIFYHYKKNQLEIWEKNIDQHLILKNYKENLIHTAKHYKKYF